VTTWEIVPFVAVVVVIGGAALWALAGEKAVSTLCEACGSVTVRHCRGCRKIICEFCALRHEH